MSKKVRADELMVTSGLTESRTKAQVYILAGQVKWKESKIQKSSQMLPIDAELSLENQMPYVGRGGLKMENFLLEANWPVKVLISWTLVRQPEGLPIVCYKGEPSQPLAWMLVERDSALQVKSRSAGDKSGKNEPKILDTGRPALPPLSFIGDGLIFHLIAKSPQTSLGIP